MRFSRAGLVLAAFGATAVLSSLPAYALDCIRDDTLAEASAILVLDAAPLTPDSVSAALREAGSDAPSAHAALFRPGPRDRLERWLDELRASSDAPLTCGTATSSTGEELWVVTARGGALTVGTDPRELGVELVNGFHEPWVVALGADGVVMRLAVDQAARVAVPSSVLTPVTIQLVARGPAGPRPVAERVLGGSPAQTSRTEATEDPRIPIAEARATASASPLRDNRLLALAARAQATAICREGRIVHELTPGQDPEARLASIGVRARLVGETLARGRDLDDALHTMLASPSHHLALVDARFTDIGVATAVDVRGRTCVAVMLAGWPRIVPP